MGPPTHQLRFPPKAAAPFHMIENIYKYRCASLQIINLFTVHHELQYSNTHVFNGNRSKIDTSHYEPDKNSINKLNMNKDVYTPTL